MCGRFSQITPLEEIARKFLARCKLDVVHDRPRYNIAPSQPVRVVRALSATSLEREIVHLRWGLVPAWSQERSSGSGFINASCETIFEKQAFRTAIRQRRCLVPCDGFYEWETGPSATEEPEQIPLFDDVPVAASGRGMKTPHYFCLRSGSLGALAAVWEPGTSRLVSTGMPASGARMAEELDTVALLTCSANELMRPIHERMPVLLAENDWDVWLSPDSSESDLQRLMNPPPADSMEEWLVSRSVNNPRFDGADCIEAVLS